MDSFSYTDNVRAAFASCLPCFTALRSESASNSPPNPSSDALNATYPESRSVSTNARVSSDLERLLRDTDSDALSLHSNLGAAAHRRARRRRRPKFSLTLFGYTLFGRPPIYLGDDDEDDPLGTSDGRVRALATASSSTFDSDAAPLDASVIERLTSPDHIAALAAQRESERRRLEAEEEARRKAERRARRQERKARARNSALMSLNGTLPRSDPNVIEGFQRSGGGSGLGPALFPFHPVIDVVSNHPDPDGDFDGSNSTHSGDADDADLGGELYTRKMKQSVVLSASGSDSRSRTSASFSAGDATHIQDVPICITHQSVPYPHTEMHLPAPVKKSNRASKRTSTVSSVTSQSTSQTPYTPAESIAESPAVAAFPIPHERYLRDREHASFPSAGLSGKRGSKSLDPRAFLAREG